METSTIGVSTRHSSPMHSATHATIFIRFSRTHFMRFA